jgi:uncharacterized protein (DUF983 family)
LQGIQEMIVSKSPSPSAATVLSRGLLGRCPCCGKGRMFGAFLKVNHHCPACGEELHHHRADDFPAYLVMLIVGHLVVPAALYVETDFAPSYWVHLALWLPLTLALAIGLLQPTKGAVVGIQWHLGLHGFERARTIGPRRVVARVHAATTAADRDSAAAVA